jgi:hypothetical protein
LYPVNTLSRKKGSRLADADAIEPFEENPAFTA